MRPYSLLSLTFLVALFLGSESLASCPPGLTQDDIVSPTDVSRTFIRSGFGEYGSSRGDNNHTGVDILTRATHQDRNAYAAFAIADGVIAYARFNGTTLDSGFGNVIIIDHGNDCYTMFGHLTSDPFTPMDDPDAALLVSLGDRVSKGQLIGYFVDHSKGMHSTGNAMRTSAGARWQTHFEFLEMPSGRSGSGRLADLFGDDVVRVDPTSTLLSLGYKIEGIVN